MRIKKYTSLLLFFIVLSVSSQEWKQNFKIVEPVRIRDNSFGFSVSTFDGYAAYSADQVKIAGVENAGKIYIAKQDCDGWSIYQELTLPDAINYCGFGTLVVMEGKTLAIVGCDPNLTLGGKTIYMYERDLDDLYKLKQKISRSENITYDNYGTTLAISGDSMVVGAFYNSTDGNLANYLENAGAAYIYHRNSNGTWDFVQKIVASDRERRDNFGNSVSIFENTIVVGAVEEGTNWAGAAYVFEKNSNSNTWRETQKLTAYDFRGLQDRFASNVKASKDEIVISAPGDDDYDSDQSGDGGGPLTFLGSIYIFRKNSSNQWVGFQKIRASDSSLGIGVGAKIEISNDKMAVGGRENVYDNTGALSKVYGRVYMFQKDNNNRWNEYQIVHPNIKNNSDMFGSTISMYKEDLFVGAVWAGLDANEQNYVGYAGAVYIFNTYDYLNSSKPVLNTIPVLTSCADLGNGFSSSFNMSSIEKELVANPQDFIFTYTDKNGNRLPSPLPQNYSNIEPFSEKINVKVANKNNPSCYEETKIELKTISAFTLNQLPDIYQCDSKGTGFAEFDLSKINSILVNDPSLYTFSYFDKNGNNITSSINQSYINSIKNFEEIVVDVTEISSSCNVKSKLNLYVSNANLDCQKQEEEEENYVIPKYFTPNADGFNDFWEITGINDQNYSIHIFDRYGKLLKMLGKNEKWDGNYTGKPLPSSDYWYQLTLENGKIKRGHFSLKR